MDKGVIFQKLIMLAAMKKAEIRICNFSGLNGGVNNNVIGIHNKLNIDELNFTLAHELAHLYVTSADEECADDIAHLILTLIKHV